MKLTKRNTELAKRGEKVASLIIATDIVDDKSAVILSRHLREAVTIVKEVEAEYADEAKDAFAKHKAVTNERGSVLSEASIGAAEGRLKMEMWAEEQYNRAEEAIRNGESVTRLFPDMDGILLKRTLTPEVGDMLKFVMWCISSGNMQLLAIDKKAMKNYVNSASGIGRHIPGIVVRNTCSVSVAAVKK